MHKRDKSPPGQLRSISMCLLFIEAMHKKNLAMGEKKLHAADAPCSNSPVSCPWTESLQTHTPCMHVHNINTLGQFPPWDAMGQGNLVLVCNTLVITLYRKSCHPKVNQRKQALKCQMSVWRHWQGWSNNCLYKPEHPNHKRLHPSLKHLGQHHWEDGGW